MAKQKRITEFGFTNPVTKHYDFMFDFRLSEQKEIDKYF